MTERYVALLRAVNVGGTGKLPMADLQAMCRDAGLLAVETYIASGNVVFTSGLPPADILAALEQRLAIYAGKMVGVILRTAAEMAAVLAGNPFPKADPKQTAVIFLPDPPPADALMRISGRVDEAAVLGLREIYVHHPSGMGRSKLKIPAAAAGTARNMNTVAKLVALTRKVGV